MPSESILIVDDNAVNAKLLSFVLARAGYVVRVAADATEALEVLESFRPRLILMDLQLPGMDGFDLTRMIKGKPGGADIVVVALTAYAMKGDDERARAAGCDGYITKPIDTRTLSGLVAEHLARPGSPRPTN